MQPDLELKPTASGRFVLGFLGVAMLSIAAIVASTAHRGNGALPLLAIFGVVGLGIVVLAVRIGARRLILDGEGVEVRGLFGRKRMAWQDIQSYKFTSIDPTNAAYAGGQGGLVGVLVIVAVKAAVRAVRKTPGNRAFKAGRLQLFGHNGDKLAVTAGFRDIDQALERIFATIHPRLSATTGTDHGKLTFDGNTISHPKKGTLALHEIEKLTVSSNGVVTIRKVGKRLGWASVSMGALTSSLLLFERLAQRGVVVEMSDAVFLPLPTLGLLSQITAARQNLPQARIQQR